MAFFFLIELEKIVLKFIWNYRRSRIGKVVLSKMNKAGGITLAFKICYKSTVTKSEVLTEVQTSRPGGTERNPEINPHIASWSLITVPRTATGGWSLQQALSGNVDAHMQKSQPDHTVHHMQKSAHEVLL